MVPLNKDPDAGIVLPELGRGAAVLTAEYTVEIREVVKAAFKGNLGNGLGSVDQESGGMAQPDLIKAVDKGFACTFLDKAAEGHLRHVHHFGYIGQGNVLFIMSFHKLEGLFNAAAGVVQVIVGKRGIG